MSRINSSHGTGAPAGLALWLICALLSLAATASIAAAGIYDATVPLQGRAEADRQASFSEALGIVAVRASGRRKAASNSVIQSANAAKYVQRYSRTGDGMLKVGFDPRSVNRLLRQAGLPVWAAERPSTLVLLSVPSAATGGQAMRTGDAAQARQDFEKAAEERGLPLVWPRSGIDVASVRSRLASGDEVELAALLTASGAQGVLAGVGSAEQIDWVFAHPGGVNRTSGSPASGADLAADAYAVQYAPASTRSLSSVSITVGGIDGLYAYAGLLDYLESLSMVRGVRVQGMDGDAVRLMVTLQGDAELLRRITQLDKHLVAGESLPDGTLPATDYVFRP